MGKDILYNGNNKKAGVAILLTDKGDFKTKANAITKKKEEYYKMIKGSIQEEDITFVNIYAPKPLKQILTDIKGEIDNNTIIV